MNTHLADLGFMRGEFQSVIRNYSLGYIRLKSIAIELR
jgi:hypothetical protein